MSKIGSVSRYALNAHGIFEKKAKASYSTQRNSTLHLAGRDAVSTVLAWVAIVAIATGVLTLANYLEDTVLDGAFGGKDGWVGVILPL